MPTVIVPNSPIIIECGDDYSPDSLGRPVIEGEGTIFTGYTDIKLTREDGSSPDPDVARDQIKCIIIRTWKYTYSHETLSPLTNVDPIEFDQTIYIIDTTAPEFLTFPDDIDIYCCDSTDPIDTGFPCAFDKCLNDYVTPTYTDSEQMPGDCSPPDHIKYYFIRTWRAEDKCGNFAEREQKIVVNSKGPFFYDCPEDIYIYVCDEVPPPADVQARDPCEDSPPYLEVEFSEQELPGDDCLVKKIIRRTWSAVDICGKPGECVQDIIVKIPNNINYWSGIMNDNSKINRGKCNCD